MSGLLKLIVAFGVEAVLAALVIAAIALYTRLQSRRNAKPRSEGKRGTALAVVVGLGIIAVAIVFWLRASEQHAGQSIESPAGPSNPADARNSGGAPATIALSATPRFNASAWNLPDEELLGFTEVPAGSFSMGSDQSKDKRADDDELPRHPVMLPAFFISRYEVTVGQYKACVKDGVCRPGDKSALGGRDDLPVRSVSWHEAVAYCGWLETQLKSWSGTPGRLADALAGRRDGRAWHVALPSEAEWERAARGDDGRIYPWGDGIDSTRANYAAANRDGPTAVGTFPGGASPDKLLDMSGNVSEWTRSRFAPYPYRSDDGRENLEAGDNVPRVVRGGSFQNTEENVRAARRFRDQPINRSDFVGFRIVISRF